MKARATLPQELSEDVAGIAANPCIVLGSCSFHFGGQSLPRLSLWPVYGRCVLFRRLALADRLVLFGERGGVRSPSGIMRCVVIAAEKKVDAYRAPFLARRGPFVSRVRAP